MKPQHKALLVTGGVLGGAYLLVRGLSRPNMRTQPSYYVPGQVADVVQGQSFLVGIPAQGPFMYSEPQLVGSGDGFLVLSMTRPSQGSPRWTLAIQVNAAPGTYRLEFADAAGLVDANSRPLEVVVHRP